MKALKQLLVSRLEAFVDNFKLSAVPAYALCRFAAVTAVDLPNGIFTQADFDSRHFLVFGYISVHATYGIGRFFLSLFSFLTSKDKGYSFGTGVIAVDFALGSSDILIVAGSSMLVFWGRHVTLLHSRFWYLDRYLASQNVYIEHGQRSKSIFQTKHGRLMKFVLIVTLLIAYTTPFAAVFGYIWALFYWPAITFSPFELLLANDSDVGHVSLLRKMTFRYLNLLVLPLLWYLLNIFITYLYLVTIPTVGLVAMLKTLQTQMATQDSISISRGVHYYNCLQLTFRLLVESVNPLVLPVFNVSATMCISCALFITIRNFSDGSDYVGFCLTSQKCSLRLAGINGAVVYVCWSAAIVYFISSFHEQSTRYQTLLENKYFSRASRLKRTPENINIVNLGRLQLDALRPLAMEDFISGRLVDYNVRTFFERVVDVLFNLFVAF